MNKLKLLLLFFIPLGVSAQLGKIKVGMTLEEVKRNFPGLKPDISSMSSWIYIKDSLDGIRGVREYVIRQDTLLRSGFNSLMVSGPCKSYPDIKSDGYTQLINEFTELYIQYSGLYGKPLEYYTESGLTEDTAQDAGHIFYAKWKAGNNELTVAISLSDKNKKYVVNGSASSQAYAQPGCKYTLEVLSIGTGRAFQKKFGNGLNGEEFKKLHPLLAPQVENHPDAWIAPDTLTSKFGYWGFTFEGGKLFSFNLNINDGEEYFHRTDSAYILMGKRTLALKAEAEKLYGNPSRIMNKIFEKYPGKSNKAFNAVSHFTEAWRLEDKQLYIQFNETSNFREVQPVFHLVLYYGPR